MEEDTAELWDRWSMQETPPDILITNYSMLNIMLFRKQENNIFEQTKKWLDEDDNNVFHLVIDEMHTYRGTAGTEVAYLLRLLLNRLGRHPNHKQIQFLASSASMQENEKTQEYLTSFFGVKKENYKQKFKLLSNPPHKAIEEKIPLTIPVNVLTEYVNITNTQNHQQATEHLFNQTKCNSYEEIAEKYNLVNCIKQAMQDEQQPDQLTARKTPQLTEKLFEEYTSETEAALEGLLILLCQCKTKSGAALQPIRSHNFFRNIDGLWACSNHNCSEIEEKNKWEERKIGKLYRSPGINTCACGAKIYEAHICRSCGEIFLFGYQNTDAEENYLHKYPTKEKTQPITFWNKKINFEILKEEQNHWQWAKLNPYSGKFEITHEGNISIFHPNETYPISSPDNCPNCQLRYKVEDKHSLTPIAPHTTGVQKVNQVMADALMRTIKADKRDTPKLVLFSDSRQAAAKLSAGIELDHYRDVLRQTVLNSLASENENIQLLKKIRARKEPLTDVEKEIIKTWIEERGEYATHLNRINNEYLYAPDDKEIKELNRFLQESTPSLQNIQHNVLLKTAFIGVNPAGPKPSLNTRGGTEWKELFDWANDKITRKDTEDQRPFLDRIMFHCNVEQLVTIFAHKNRSFESLKLGYISTNLTEEDPKFAQFTDVAIRLLGENWRIDGYESKYPRTSLPQSVWKFAKNVYGDKKGKNNHPYIDKLSDILKKKQIVKPDENILTGKNLYFKRSNPGDPVWICTKCNTPHLHESCGICVNCYSNTLNKRTITEDELNNQADYYIYLAQSEPFRLHCEELTGQTSKEDSTKRQRLFQGILLNDENKQVDEIDLLSVTTTMEAGVDIGSLSAVMMGNVPPNDLTISNVSVGPDVEATPYR